MRKAVVHSIAGVGVGLALLSAAASVAAADLALIASGGKGDARPQLAQVTNELVAAYTKAGYQVIDGRRADRGYLIGLLEDFEYEAEASDRLVIHLVGPLAESGGLTLFLPDGAAPSSITDIMTEGLPLQLFLDLVDQGEGRGMLALGITNFRKQPASGLNPPAGVLLLRGFPVAVNAVVVEQMLSKGRSAGEIDTRALSVEVEGQVTNSFRLVSSRERSPAQRENDLNLSRGEREQIQRDLRILGFQPGTPDGAFGDNTRTAIYEWQRANGYPGTGYLTSSQISEITKSGAATRDDLRAARDSLRDEGRDWEKAQETDTIDAYRAFVERHPNGRFRPKAQLKIAELEEKIEMARRIIEYRQTEDDLGLTLASGAVVERRLEALGYDTGPTDGRFDRQTRRALAAFQDSRGLEPSGYIDTATLQRLIIAGAGN